MVEGGASPGEPASQIERADNYYVTVQIEPQYQDKLDANALHRLAVRVLQAEGAETPVEVGIVVTGDEEVHALNRQYLGHDYKTDVISFGMAEVNDRFVTPSPMPAHLGDVVISYDRAAEQAPEYGHSAGMEVAVLLVHGLLHLLGYDDLDRASRERMHARQDELVQGAEFGPA